MMKMNLADVETVAYRSYMRLYPDIPEGLDQHVRHPELTRQLLDKIGVDDASMNNMLVTGSKGKGSLTVLLAHILVHQGKKTGLFTSPHLQHFKERIRLDGKALPDDIILAHAVTWKKALDAIEEGLPENVYVGPVGATAALAMSIYQTLHTDINVIELGRGARYDDVNQIHGTYAFINRIFLEHGNHLGQELAQIAYHKAGIIKKGMLGVFVARQKPEVEQIILAEAKKMSVPVYCYGKDFSVRHVTLSTEGTTFDYLEEDRVIYKGLTIGLLGHHQAQNAAMALFSLRRMHCIHDEQAMRASLPQLHWMGRLEIIANNPFTLLDGCISHECVQHILSISEKIPRHPVVCVVGIPEEKDYMGVVSAIKYHVDQLIVTHATNDFLKFSEHQVLDIRTIYSEAVYEPDIKKAILEAQKRAGQQGKILYVGTQSLIKDIKSAYGQSTMDIF